VKASTKKEGRVQTGKNGELKTVRRGKRKGGKLQTAKKERMGVGRRVNVLKVPLVKSERK
jgi:hypothetical protein